MFDLERAISEWRRQLAGGGIGSPDVLDELESHLREDVQQQVRLGHSPEQAFNGAGNGSDNGRHSKWNSKKSVRAGNCSIN
jgi:hypothetical protein